MQIPKQQQQQQQQQQQKQQEQHPESTFSTIVLLKILRNTCCHVFSLSGNCNATIPQEIETTRYSCAQSDWSVIVVAGGYALFMDLLLVNLVIAMFR